MKSSRLVIISVLCVTTLAIAASPAKAQTFYDIEGVIEGPDSTPVGGVAVFLEDLTRARIGQTITSSDGRYRFNRVIAGTYYLVARPNGSEFRSATRRLELIDTSRSGAAPANEKVDIVLETITRRIEPRAGTVFAQEVPPEATTRYERASENLAKKNNVQAIKDLTEALRVFPNYFMASQQLGLIYVEIEEYQKAIPPLVKAIEINPKAGASYVALGIASLKLGRPDLALDALQRARPLEEGSFRVHFYLGLTLLELKRLDDAENALKTAYKLGGPSKAASAHLYLASIYSTRGQHQQAISELETYLRESPKAANAASIKAAIASLKSKL
jgi:tetratricopeptide (TPR) repeat protein